MSKLDEINEAYNSFDNEKVLALLEDGTVIDMDNVRFVTEEMLSDEQFKTNKGCDCSDRISPIKIDCPVFEMPKEVQEAQEKLEEAIIKSIAEDHERRAFEILTGIYEEEGEQPDLTFDLIKWILEGEEEEVEPPVRFDYTTDEGRKEVPLFSGLVQYFPDALKHVAHCSKVANDQHNPNQRLHWNKDKSKQELDSMLRHLFDSLHEDVDSDGIYHLAKVAWRSLSELQRRLEGSSIYKNY